MWREILPWTLGAPEKLILHNVLLCQHCSLHAYSIPHILRECSHQQVWGLSASLKSTCRPWAQGKESAYLINFPRFKLHQWTGDFLVTCDQWNKWNMTVYLFSDMFESRCVNSEAPEVPEVKHTSFSVHFHSKITLGWNCFSFFYSQPTRSGTVSSVFRLI